MAANVTILARKNMTWHTAPTVSRILMNLGSQKFPMKGHSFRAHIISVECHRCGVYSVL